MRRHLTLAIPCCAAIGIALGGCGGNPKPDVVVKDFVHEWETKDYKKACIELAASAEAEAAGQALVYGPIDKGDPCEAALKALRSRFVKNFDALTEIEDVDISSDNQHAIATNSAGGTWQLVEIGGHWRIAEPLPFLNE